VYIRDFVAYSQDMQDDSGYKFSDEYEVRTCLGGMAGSEGGAGDFS